MLNANAERSEELLLDAFNLVAPGLDSRFAEGKNLCQRNGKNGKFSRFFL